MPTTDRDAQALTYLARRLRTETHGCREWDEAGTYAKVSEFVGQNLAMAIEAVLCHATDPDAKTPGSLHRPFLPPKPSEQPKGHATPPKRAEECRTHPGQHAINCGGCRADALAATYDDEPPTTPTTARPASEATKTAALAAMRSGFHGKEED